MQSEEKEEIRVGTIGKIIEQWYIITASFSACRICASCS